MIQLRFQTLLILAVQALLVAPASYAVVATETTAQWIEWHPLPTTSGISEGAFVGESNGILLVAGGRTAGAVNSGTAYSDRILALLPSANSEWLWKDVGQLPFPVANGAAVTTDEGLWCIGGENHEGPSAAVFLIQWNAQQQTAVLSHHGPALPNPVTEATATTLNGIIYLAGGKTGQQLSTAFLACNPITDTGWQELTPPPAPATTGPTLIAQGTGETYGLFLIGGEPVVGSESSAYRYHPPTDEWFSITPPPIPLQKAAGLAVGSAHIFLSAPGNQPAGSSLLLAYHTITDTWTELSSPLTGAFQPLGLIQSGNQIQLIGHHEQQLSGATGQLTSASKHFTGLDYVSLSIYLSIIVLIGLWFTKRGSTTNDYFLAGNKIPWWAAGISLLATQVSSIGFMAVPAKSFATNWAYFLGVLTWFIVVPVVTRYFIPYFRRLQVASAYSYLELRFNIAVRLFATISFSLMQLGRLAVVLLLPALALSTVTDLDLLTCILLMGAIATLYTITGGMAAVVWTDVVQAFILITGALIAVVTVFLSLDGGVAQFTAIVQSDRKMQMFLPTMDVGAAAAWVVIVGNIFSRFSGLTSDQSIIQRYLTTKDSKASCRALWLDVAVSVPWAIIAFLLGTALYVFYKTHPALLHPAVNTDGIVPLFIAQALPPGLTGILIAAIFAAAMSSLDSAMHSTSTVLVSDIYERFFPQSTQRSRLLLAKGIVLTLGIFGTLFAAYLATTGIKSIWDQFISIIGLFVGVLSGLFILGVFTKRTNGWDALAGALAGAMATYWVSQHTRVSFFLYPGVGIIVCVLIGWLISWIPIKRFYTRQHG